MTFSTVKHSSNGLQQNQYKKEKLVFILKIFDSTDPSKILPKALCSISIFYLFIYFGDVERYQKPI